MTPPSQDRFHLFLPTGSIWFGILAWTMYIAAATSLSLGWGKVSVPERTTAMGTRIPAYEEDRIEVWIRDSKSTGNIGIVKAFLWPALALAALGDLLALVSVLIPRRKWLYIGLGFALNSLVYVGIGFIPKWV